MTKQQLMVKHIPQVPMKAFEVEVNSVKEAVRVMDLLADYDIFQYENNVKPDYSNATFLEVWCEDCGDWTSWDIEIKDDEGDIIEYFDDPRTYLHWLGKKEGELLV